MKQITIKYGIIAGIIVAAFMLLSLPLMKDMANNYDTAQILGYVSMLLSLSTIFVAIKTFRDKFNGGKVKFGKAFLIGLYITLIAAVIYALVFVIADALSSTSFSETYRDYYVADLNSDASLSAVEKTKKIADMDYYMELYKNPIIKFFITMVEYVPVGLIVSLIAAAILKKK